MQTNTPAANAATPGTITISAEQNATINATSAAAAVAIAGGGAALSVAAGGAIATNVILGATSAYAVDSSLDAGGDITVEAINGSTIDALVAGVSAAVSIGGISVGASVGAGLARNFIGYEHDGDRAAVVVEAYLSDTEVETYGALDVSASSEQTIKAEVAAASVAIAAGGVYALGLSAAGAYTENRVAADVQAYIDGGAVVAGDATIAAADTSTINAFAGAASLAVAIGGVASDAVSIGVATAINSIDNDIAAYVTDVASFRVTGDIPVQSNGYIYTVPVRTLNPGTGVLGVDVNDIDNDNNKTEIVWLPPVYTNSRGLPAYAVGTGLLSITANETATLTSHAAMASVAANFGIGITVAGGGSVTTNDVTSETRAWVADSTLDVQGDVTVGAYDTTTVDSLVQAISVAAGIFSLAASGAYAESNIASNVSAKLEDTDITARDVVVEASATPKAKAEAQAVNAGTAAVGLSFAKALVDTHVSASIVETIGEQTTLDVDNLRVSALQKLPTTGDTAFAKAQGLAGGLIGADATITEALNKSTVSALLGAGTVITAVRSVNVAAQNDSRQRADSDSAAFGLVAAGATKATAKSLPHQVLVGTDLVDVANTTAEVGNLVQITAGSVSISALGSDDNFAKASPGAGGLVGIAAAVATTETKATTLAVLGDNTVINVSKAAVQRAGETAAAFALYQVNAGRFSIAADHMTRANTQIITSAYGVLAGSGAEADNYINSTVLASVGNNAEINAAAISGVAVNRFDKPDIGENVNGSTGGLAAAAGVSSDTHLTLNTKMLVHDQAELTVTGSSLTVGELSLAALNLIHFRENVVYKGGGAASGIGATSTFNAQNVFATVQLGTNENATQDNGVLLDTSGRVTLSANTHADAALNVSVDNYGGLTVSAAAGVIDLSPTNAIIVGRGAEIEALRDVNMLAGVDVNFNHDEYTVRVYTDTFAGSVIPLGSVKANAFLYQKNTISILADAKISSGGNVRLFADRNPFAQMTAQAKAVNWASSAAGALDSAVGGSAHAQYDGTAHADTHGIVTVDGTIETGLNRNVNLRIIKLNANDPVPAGAVAVGTDIAGLRMYVIGQGAQNVTANVGIDAAAVELFRRDRDGDRQEGGIFRQCRPRHFLRPRNRAARARSFSLSASPRQVPVIGVGGAMTVVAANAPLKVTINGVHYLAELIPVQREALTVKLDPIFAEAGYIHVQADILQGSGKLDAPGNVSVTIDNQTEAFLDIGGVYIPENNGGVFLNGFENEISKVALPANATATQVNAAINSALNTANALAVSADNGDDQRGGEELLAAGTANLDVTRTFGVRGLRRAC